MVFYQVGVVVAPNTPQLFVEGRAAELCEVSFAFFYPSVEFGLSHAQFHLLVPSGLWCMGWDFVSSAKEGQGLSPSLTRSALLCG